MKKVITIFILAIQMMTLTVSPLVHAYPTLTYSGDEVGMHFSPSLVGAQSPILQKDARVFLHLHKGSSYPSDSYLKRIEHIAQS
ncbi:MAG: hypothetical protein ACRCTB_06315, partial [Vibrio sp.]